MRSESWEPSGTNSRADSFPSVQGDDNCDDCHQPDVELSFCNDCDIYLCSKCWPKQPAHRTQRSARGGARHEKTNISLARKINNVLAPTSDPQELTQLHENDAQTAWFGKLMYPDIGQSLHCRYSTPRRREYSCVPGLWTIL